MPFTDAGITDGAAFYDLLLEAVSYLRDGSWATFEATVDAVAAASPDDGHSAADTGRTLAALAHIEIQLDRRTLRPIAWSCAPPTLTPLDTDTWLLSGRRPSRLVTLIARRVEL